MQPRGWPLRIQDILDAIAKIERFTSDHGLDSFQQDEMAMDAVIRNFEIIGEAARFIPADVEARHP